jgi:O-antigen ligase
MNFYSFALAAILILSSVTDFTRRLAVGSLTLQGVLTIVLGTGLLGLILMRRRLPKAIYMASWLVVFLCIGAISVYLNKGTALIGFRDQAQNLLVYAIFVWTMLLSAMEAYAQPITPPWYLTDGFTRAAGIWMGARSFAIFAVIAVAWCLACWRYKVFPYAGWYAAGLVLLIAFSYSRTATVAGLLLFPLAQISPRDPRGWGRVGVWMGLIGLIAYLSFTYIEPVRSRFTEQGDNATVGGVRMNTSGRDRIWQSVSDSAAESPWFGKGPGSAGIAVQKVNATVHPHNDYLRLLHDFGKLGLGLWAVGYGGLFVQALQNWYWAEQSDRMTAHVHAAAVLAMAVVAFVMITDNVVVYLFAMAPLGILVGTSIGIASARRKILRQAKPLEWMEDWSIDEVQVNPLN